MTVGSLNIDPRLKVFCNRSLNMKCITAVGFDMDYTLALYKPAFELLAYKETLIKLVQFGYPEEILNFEFDWTHMIRGLVIDKKRGNVFKMDRHRYIKIAYHGFRELTREERLKYYAADKQVTFEEPDFALIDTLFTLADAYLFSQLVDLKEKKPELLPQAFLDLYRDVRKAIDLCHRDGSIKFQVAKDPSLYIERDAALLETLKLIKNSGRKVFLATNSLWDYTHVVMNYLFGNESKELNTTWVSAFDYIITGAAKPSFFMSHNPLYEVDSSTGLLRNSEMLNSQTQIFQGGNFHLLHAMLGVQTGSEVLYVGDHIYGDILRSKKELGWRTMLVIEELESEINSILKYQTVHDVYEECLEVKDRIDVQLQQLALEIANNPGSEKKLQSKIATLQKERAEIRAEQLKYLREYHRSFHPTWGQLMKTGHQNSRFAAQVQNYACLYTSRLTNLRFYSSSHSYRSTRDLMPHDSQ